MSAGLLVVFARFLNAFLGSKLASFGTERLITALSAYNTSINLIITLTASASCNNTTCVCGTYQLMKY